MATNTGSISINWPIPTNLSYEMINNGGSLVATFIWDKISNDELVALDPSGGGFSNIYWRVQLNSKTYLVYNEPKFRLNLPLGCCNQCVKVQTIYVLNSTSALATSMYSNEVCAPCRVDPYCNKSKKTNTVTVNYGSSNMRYAKAVRRAVTGGKNAFR
tara:strand:+ start:47 stop:520 length:474 start_codon:yes stop_codon:yes gene_type:complete